MAKPQQDVIVIPLTRSPVPVFRQSKQRDDSGKSGLAWKAIDNVSVSRIEFDLFVRANKRNRKVRVPFLFDTGADRTGIRVEVARRIVGSINCNPQRSALKRWVLVNGVFDRFYAPLHEFYWSFAEEEAAEEFKTECFVIPSEKARMSLHAMVEKVIDKLIWWRPGDQPISLLCARDLLREYDVQMGPFEMTLTRRRPPKTSV